MLDIASNAFTGELPNTYFFIYRCSTNYFTGTVMTAFGDASQLQALELSSNYNYLYVSISPTLGLLSSLQLLNMSSNMLTGGVSIFLSHMMALELLDLLRNCFSGSLLSLLFETASGLRNVLLYINCFSGTIPDTVCVASNLSVQVAPNLSVIVFDGASSAKACDVRLPEGLQEVFEVVLSKKSLSGSIPTCVWSMPLLTTLHAAGNGLRGSLGELYQVISRLSVV